MGMTIHTPGTDEPLPCRCCRPSRLGAAARLAAFVVLASAVLGLAVRVFLLLALGG